MRHEHYADGDETHHCPRCGPGYYLADHADRRHCGACGYAEQKEADADA